MDPFVCGAARLPLDDTSPGSRPPPPPRRSVGCMLSKQEPEPPPPPSRSCSSCHGPSSSRTNFRAGGTKAVRRQRPARRGGLAGRQAGKPLSPPRPWKGARVGRSQAAMPTTLTDPGGDPQLPGRKAASSKLGQRAANSDGKGRRGKGAAGWMDGWGGGSEGGRRRPAAGRQTKGKKGGDTRGTRAGTGAVATTTNGWIEKQKLSPGLCQADIRLE